MIHKYWGFQIPTDILLKMRLAAAKCGRTMTEIVISGIEWELDLIDRAPVNDGVKKEIENS